MIQKIRTILPVPDPFFPEPRFDDAVACMAQEDIGSWPEIALRCTIIFSGMVAATLVTDDLWISVFLLTYFAFDIAYRRLLKSAVMPVTYNRYALICLTSVISKICYTLCAGYLFFLGAIETVVLGVCATAAQAMYALARLKRINAPAIVEISAVSINAGIFGVFLATTVDDLAGKAVVVIASFGVISYYLLAQYRSIKVNMTLDAARAEAVQTQKVRAVGRLTSGVAHDFNNLLTVIRGNIELAELGLSAPERTHHLKLAKDSADSAATLVSQLLSYSRKARLQAQIIDVAPFISKVKNMIDRLIPVSMEVSIEHDPQLATLYCDPAQLETTILNLVTNARDASQAKGQVIIRLGPASGSHFDALGISPARDQRFGFVEFQDDGPGIPAEMINRVTDPFFTTKPVGKGSGLGLSMAKGFSEQSGGGLHIHKSQGKGARITLVLPCAPLGNRSEDGHQSDVLAAT